MVLLIALFGFFGCQPYQPETPAPLAQGNLPRTSPFRSGKTNAPPPAAATVDPIYLPFLTSPTDDAAYLVEIRNGDRVLGAIDFPFHYRTSPGDYLLIELRGDRWQEPRLGLRILQLTNEEKVVFDPDDFTLIVGESRLTPEVKQIEETELRFEWYWRLPPEARHFRLEVKPQRKFALKIAEEPLRWSNNPEQPNIRPSPFLEPNPAPELIGKDFLIDYYFRGAYRRTYFRPDFSRCTRPDDFLVLHLRPGAMTRPHIQLFVREFTHPLIKQLHDHDWLMKTEDGTMIGSFPAEGLVEGNDRPGLIWHLPKKTHTVILEQKIPVRFTLRISDGEPLDSPVTTADGEPCFP